MFKFNNKDTRTTPMAVFWCLCLWLWRYFFPFSSVSIANFEHVIANWVYSNKLGISTRFTPIFLFCIPGKNSEKTIGFLALSGGTKNRILVWNGLNGMIRRSCWYPIAITCSKLTIETVEQGVKYVQN